VVPAVPKPVAEKIPPRGQLVPKLFKALKAQYKPVVPTTNRPLLDQTLVACCLENAPADVAERAFGRLLESYFDLNEVRVTTVAELAETLHDLPDPAHAALSLRRVLQSVFESTYSFSLEHAKKHSLAHGLKTLEHLHGVPQFVVAHVVSTALGGHMIPLDKGAMAALYVCGLITRQEYDSGKVAGLERVIGKKSGVEFSSLLHQFGIECLTNLHGATVKKIVMAVNPAAAKERMPKRGEPLPQPSPPPAAADRERRRAAAAARTTAEEHRPAGPQAAARPAGKTPMPPAGSGPKKTADGKPGGKPGPKPFVVKPNMGKPLTIKPQLSPPPQADTHAPKPASAKKPAAAAKRPEAGGDRHSADLGKRKPK
jgi:endonuclease III